MDRTVQASLLLVLEPIFEADFKPVSYGFRPGRRTQDAIAEIHALGWRSNTLAAFTSVPSDNTQLGCGRR